MKKILYLSQIIISFLVLVFVFGNPVQAAKLKLSPASGSYELDETVEVKVDMVVETGEEIVETEVRLDFDNTRFQVTQIEEKALFASTTSEFNNSTGAIVITAAIDPGDTPVTGSGTLAVLSLKAKGTGTSEVTFVTRDDNAQAHSKIIKSGNGEDALSVVTDGIYTITSDDGANDDGDTGGFGGVGTPIPTPTPVVNPNLPDAGNPTPMIILLLGGGALLIFGIAGRKLQKIYSNKK